MEVEDPNKQWFYDTMCRYIEDQRKALAEQRQATVETPADHSCALIGDPPVCVPAMDQLLKCSAPSMVEAGDGGFESHGCSDLSDLSIAMSTRCSMECSNGSTGLFPSMASTDSGSVVSGAVHTDEYNFKCATTKDDLSPGARCLYGLIIGGSASPTSAATSCVPSSVHESAASSSTATAAMEIFQAMASESSTAQESLMAYSTAGIRTCTATTPISTTGRSTTTSVSVAAYKLFDRMPRCPEWSPECVLSIMVCRALYPVNEDLLRSILAPYGVKRLVMNPRATTRSGSHYMTAIVELRSRDEAARARVSLQGKCLFAGCCYLQIKFASPYELASTVISTEVVSAAAAKDGLSLGARRLYNLIIGSSTSPTTAASPRNHEPATTPSSATPTLSWITYGTAPEFDTPVVSDEALVANVTRVAALPLGAANYMGSEFGALFVVSPSTCPALLACGDFFDADDTSAGKVFLDSEQIFLTTAISSEVSTFQLLKLPSGLCASVQWPSPLVEVLISTEEKKLVTISVAAYQATSWIDSQASSHVWTVLRNLNGGFSFERLWDPGIELPEDELESACTSMEKLVAKLDIAEIQECLQFSQPKPPWSHMTPVISASEFGSYLRTVSEPVNITDSTFPLILNNFAARYMLCLRASLYSTMRHPTQLLGIDTGQPKWQNSTNILNGRAAEQHSLQGSLGMALVEWTPWSAGFAVQSYLGSQEFYTRIKIERLRGLQFSREQFITKGITYFDSWYFEWQIPWCFCLHHANSSINWLRMQPVGDHGTFKYTFLFSLDVTSTDSVTTIKHLSAMFSTAFSRPPCAGQGYTSSSAFVHPA